MWSSIAIVACFVIGVCAGRWGWWSDKEAIDLANTGLLYLLLLLIGLYAGADRRTWTAFRTLGSGILVAPASAVVGSGVGAAVLGMVLTEWSVGEMLAAGWGLGYYSLSSVMIGQMHGDELALIALLANIIREITTILLAVPISRVFGPIAPIASGGATSADTTLPAILNASGKEAAVPAVFNGIVLTFLVPILVTLALQR